MTMHPQSCKDPANCTLTYVEHLRGFNISAEAIPTRRVNRTEGQPDEPLTQALTREKRWERDISAYRRLHNEGVRPPQVDGAALREKHGDNLHDMEHRRVNIDYNDAK